MRKLFTILCLLIPISFLSAQNHEPSISFYADVLLHADESEHRMFANERFLELIKSQLKSDSSFQNSFAINKIPLLYAPDSSFRLISWELYQKDKSTTFGFIQMKGASSLIQLEDKSTYLASQEYGFLYPDKWLGAVYTSLYQIPGRDSLYLLRGFNSLDQYSTLHVLDILNLEDSDIRFGSPIFENEKKDTVHRRIYQVAAGANFRLEIADSLQRIITAHLTPVPYNRNGEVMVNVPDGTYEVLAWEGGIWLYKERLFEQKFQDLPMEHVPNRKNERDIFGRERD